jgi:hypothetical protein
MRVDAMIRTGDAYREGLRDGREGWIEGERVRDVTAHPALKPIIDVRARMYDMAFEAAHQDRLTYVEDNRRKSIFNRPPAEAKDWTDKLAAVDAVLKDIGGVVTRVGDETVGEMWSLQDGRDVLAEIDPRFTDNIDHHIAAVRDDDLFHEQKLDNDLCQVVVARGTMVFVRGQVGQDLETRDSVGGPLPGAGGAVAGRRSSGGLDGGLPHCRAGCLVGALPAAA